MKTVVYQDSNQIAIKNVAKPKESLDFIQKVTPFAAAIYSCDEGRMDITKVLRMCNKSCSKALN